MNRNLRAVLAIIWGLIGAGIASTFFVWLDRASHRNETPTFNGWGLFFVIGLLLLAAGVGLAYELARRNMNEIAIAISVICAVAATLALVYIPKHIGGWSGTLHLTELVVCILIWVAVMYTIVHTQDA